MLVSNVIEKTKQMAAAENMASRLADKVRNVWQENLHHGRTNWEESFYEDPDGVRFLSEESFPDLQGIDYIFKWWGNDDPDGLAGELEVLWKVRKNGSIQMYKTWIRLAERDFVLGVARDEPSKRRINREAFCAAFAEWQKLYIEAIAE